MYSHASPSPAAGSSAYEKLKTLVKRDSLDTYICQAYDHANLAILAMAKARTPPAPASATTSARSRITTPA